MKTQNLITWIDSHDRPQATIDNGNGTLTVFTLVVLADRTLAVESDVIPATLQAARDLLGY